MDLSENLISNETVVFQTRKHPIAPIRASLAPAGLLVLALLVAWIRPGAGDGLLGFIREVLGLVQIGLAVAGIGWIAYNVIVWRTAVFAVTNLRVLRYEGLIQRRTSETLLRSVSDVQLRVGMIGKQLGFGDLQILTGSGSKGSDLFESIVQPLVFRNALMEQKLAEQTGRPVPAPVVPSAATVAPHAPAPRTLAAPARPTAAESADTIRRLAELRDQGILTPEEFEAKKTEILARI